MGFTDFPVKPTYLPWAPTDPAVQTKVQASRIPEGYSWGEWCGDYRIIEREGREVCRVGGLAAKVTREPNINAEIIRAIHRGELGLARR